MDTANHVFTKLLPTVILTFHPRSKPRSNRKMAYI